jgi:uncharacterized protein (TIGR02117 family)
MTTVRSNPSLPVGVGIQVISLWLLLGCNNVNAEWSCAAGQSSCASVFIVHDTWHAAIVLRTSDISAISIDALPELGDFPDVQFIEFSWGDQDYFPDPNSGVWAALRAAFWSGGSVLHLVGFNEAIAQFYPGAKLTELRLDANGYRRMIDFISQTFARPAAKIRAPASSGLFAYSRFYPARTHFSVLRTCNSWVAEALEAAGLPLSPRWVITASNLASQLEALNR